jgi:predicted O-methyltransferase YrrM
MTAFPFPPSPVQARHAEYSMIYSADDDMGRPSVRLIEIALEASRRAQGIALTELCARLAGPPYYPEVWPGEHYRLLAALVQLIQPSLVVEIGTATGLSALAMKSELSNQSKIATFDLVPWDHYPGTCLTGADFDHQLVQFCDDLSLPSSIEKHADLLAQAEIIFIDAAKDGRGEQLFLENFRRITFVRPPILVLDDIRLWNMLAIWRRIALPKLDLTSFGHWSGTGLVDWRGD